MKILRYNIGLVILLSIAGVQTSTEAEDPRKQNQFYICLKNMLFIPFLIFFLS